jgi:putative hydrolase of the HAD superfamily
MTAQAVVFDLFGTLIDDSSPTTYSDFLAETARLLGTDLGRFEDLWARYDVARYTGPIEDCFATICSELEISDRTLVESALAFRRERLRTLMVPRSDAVETLTALRGRGLGLGMISNASSDVPPLWADSVLAPLFDSVLFSADERMMKPDRRLYERMAGLLGVGPEDCLYVGDGAYRELQGAAAAGMTPVLIRVPHDEWVHDGTVGWRGLRVSSLSDVLALV